MPYHLANPLKPTVGRLSITANKPTVIVLALRSVKVGCWSYASAPIKSAGWFPGGLWYNASIFVCLAVTSTDLLFNNVRHSLPLRGSYRLPDGHNAKVSLTCSPLTAICTMQFSMCGGLLPRHSVAFVKVFTDRRHII